MSKLYRGVSKLEDMRLEGKIIPKGFLPKLAMKHDGSILRDGKFTYGESENNMVRAHQLDSDRHNTKAISTTRNFNEALKFATSNNLEDGFIYSIDETRLASYNIKTYEFLDPESPHEEEVTLVLTDIDELPQELILDKVAVFRS